MPELIPNELSSSPLNLASPTSLDELLSKDPKMLTTDELDLICSRLRAERLNWNTKTVAKKEKRAAPKLTAEEKKAQSKALLAQLDLTNLFD